MAKIQYTPKFDDLVKSVRMRIKYCWKKKAYFKDVSFLLQSQSSLISTHQKLTLNKNS